MIIWLIDVIENMELISSKIGAIPSPQPSPRWGEEVNGAEMISAIHQPTHKQQTDHNNIYQTSGDDH